jgi:hypothetical protein
MFRRCGSGLCALLLVVASLQAPFAHEHPGDPDHHHAEGFVHGHFGHADHHDDDSVNETQSGLDHDETDQATVWLSWAPSAQPRVEIVAIATSAVLELTPELVRVGTPLEFAPTAHSPPPQRFRSPRAPPA